MAEGGGEEGCGAVAQFGSDEGGGLGGEFGIVAGLLVVQPREDGCAQLVAPGADGGGEGFDGSDRGIGE